MDAALGWVGQRIDDVYGGRLGKVEDVYADGRTGKPVWLVVRLGRFGDDHVAVPAGEAVAGEGGVWIPYERQAVRSAGPLRRGQPLTRERDLALAAHFGVSEARERSLHDAPPASVTCVSALAGDGEVVSG
ncbi:MAG: PRC-barrel domain-containing protein [Thermoleophilaceae bacterium]